MTLCTLCTPTKIAAILDYTENHRKRGNVWLLTRIEDVGSKIDALSYKLEPICPLVSETFRDLRTREAHDLWLQPVIVMLYPDAGCSTSQHLP